MYRIIEEYKVDQKKSQFWTTDYHRDNFIHLISNVIASRANKLRIRILRTVWNKNSALIFFFVAIMINRIAIDLKNGKARKVIEI